MTDTSQTTRRTPLPAAPPAPGPSIDADAAVAAAPSTPDILSTLASVGLQRPPFDRLVRAVETWALSRGQSRSTVVHTGPSDVRLRLPALAPVGCRALVALAIEADVAVIAGDPTLVLACLDSGRRPIVFPRRPELAELGNDREVRLARRLAGADVADVARSARELHTLLDRRLAAPIGPEPPTSSVEDLTDLVAYWARVTVSERSRDRRVL